MPSRYDHLTHDELVRLLEARDRRDATRFGLVWEANEIERDKAVNADFVALDLDPALSTPTTAPEGGWGNLIIEGDNFDALRHLRMTHAGRVKCILIDPPYNTGKKDFVYNDKFIDANDSWRFSTWIEFLFQRLIIARDLLSDDGVMFLCINDDGRAKLELLLDKVMPGRRVGSFVWRTRSGSNDSKEYFRSIDHEHVLCYANPGFTFSGSIKATASYSNPDNDKRGPWGNDNLVQNKTVNQRPNTFYPIENPENNVWYACDPDNVWRFSSEQRLRPGQQLRSKTIEQIIREKKVLWPKDETFALYNSKNEIVAAIRSGTAPRNLRIGDTPEEIEFWDREQEFWIGKKIGFGKPRYKRHLSEVKRSEKPLSSWFMPSSTKREERLEIESEEINIVEVGGTSDGTSLLQEILGTKAFDYPKPLSLIQALVRQSTEDGDTVLDFFAGSGTTAHAVLAQNEEDNCDRKFILVSNTESNSETPNKNICRDVCARRVRTVINGYTVSLRKGTKDVAPLPGDFAYLRCRRIPAGELLEIEHEEVWTALQMIHLETLRPFADTPFQSGGDDSARLVYVPRFTKAMLPALREAVDGATGAIVYSWQPETLRQHLPALHVQHEAIPENLARRFGLGK